MMRRHRRLAAVSALVALLALAPALAAANRHGGRGAPATAGAGSFVLRVLEEELHGRWASQWDDLHPAHRQLISRSQYVACSRGLGTALGDEVLAVRSVTAVPILVPHVPQRTAARVTVSMHEPGSSESTTFQVHAVAVGGRWTWILGPAFLSQLERGRCLDGMLLSALDASGPAV